MKYDRIRNSIELIRLYVVLLPAFALVFAFLILPTLQTIFASFTVEIRISEEEVRGQIEKIASESNARIENDRTRVKELPGWEAIIGKLDERLGIAIRTDSIPDDLTVRGLREQAVMRLNEKQRQS